MKTKEKGLQKLTETDKKINELLNLEQITPSDLQELTATEKSQFFAVLTEKFNGIKGDERDAFLKKIEAITDQSIKNQLWENNHIQITSAISTLMQDYGCMPTKNHIAEKTGLSRQTIYKHLKEYNTHPQYLVQIEQFRFMTSKVLAKVFSFAVNGDVKAARLYLEIIGYPGSLSSFNTVVNTQNNFIQINQMKLSQETIKQLNSEQLKQIEEVLQRVTSMI